MSKKSEIVYVNNSVLGYFKDNVYKNYTKEQKNELLSKIKNEIVIKDSRRKMFSWITGLLVLLMAITLSLLMIIGVVNLGPNQWFIYIFILAGFVFLWLLLYNLVGLFFYARMTIDFHFKSSKGSDINSCVTYASSNYSKWINNHSESLSEVAFYREGKKKDELVGFGLKVPSWKKSLIFNGHIITNIPYFYFIDKGRRIIILPGIMIVVDGKNSDVFSLDELEFKCENKTYQLLKEDKLLLSFNVKGEFNINFLYFRFEQL